MVKEDFSVEIKEEPISRSDYETERNKPMPNRIHGTIQTAITVALSIAYRSDFSFPNEVTLNKSPIATPDICIYPKKKLHIKESEVRETEMPLTTIEIQSPFQSPDELFHKAWDVYFPAGVKSAWIVIPTLKAIRVLMPDDQNLLFTAGTIHDPTTGIELPLEKVFEDVDL
ncbi:MAG TPA: Uma2 family endonuclease [Saprospiraceae bacterium]|nr:Uma2 family endonuclease [Saprospiraceae bacterium]HMQ84440.1 Uma2 family endonuclease [Saprospiraceae bacterium]